MAFPTSPANNQTALVNGIVYQWNNTLGAWKRNGSINAATIGQLLLNSAQTSTSNNSGTLIVAGGAGISGNLYTGGIYITGSANGITFPDGTVQTTAGVAVDAFARSTANSASSNTVIIQGVDNTQNTNITIATNAATAAFAQANATAGGLITANARITVVEGVDLTQNTRMTIIEGVDTAQNTRMAIIEGVDTTQNTNITIATNAATAAFAQANATAGGLTTANSRIDVVGGVNTSQNTRMSIIEGVDLTQNTNITNADTKAQAAFDKANTAITTSGGSITGSLNVSQNLAVTGNLTVLGTTTTINTSSFTVNDSLITLGVGNYTSDLLDIGISAHYNDGTNAHTGFIRDHGTKEWYVFKGYTPELNANNNININDASFAKANVNADYFKGNVAFPDGTFQTSAASSTDSYARTTANAAFTQANTVYLPSVTRLDVTHSGSSAYLLDQYSGNNPTIYINAGETIAFNLNVSGHPFMIRVSSGGSNYDTGLTHITNAGDVTTGSNAQGKVSGILFWKVPFDIAGNTYVYQCSAHAGMVGSITIGQPSSIVLSTLQGVNTTQNTRLSSIETINTDQNTSISIIQGVDVTQNTRIGSIETINTDQNTAISIIQGVNITQNTNISIIQGVDLTQNTNITIADSKAQAAFDFANTISGGSAIDNVARASVNTATTLAQAAFNKANDAYTLANTANAAAGSGGASLTSFTTTVDTFTGNGSQTTFTLSVTPDSEDSTFVFLNGVYQEKSTYSVSGSSLILTDVATANDDIEVTTVSGSIMNVSPSAYSTRIYQGNGSTNTFTISSGHTANTIMVFNNGVCQFPVDDYTVSNTTLTYVLTPESDETIQIRELPINKLVPLTYQMRRYTANGVQTQFTVTAGQTANSTFVFENGICQVPISDYTVSGATLTFVTAPVANVIIQIREASI